MIYNAVKRDKIPHKEPVVNGMRNIFNSERYIADIKNKRAIFDNKKWNTVLNYFNNNS